MVSTTTLQTASLQELGLDIIDFIEYNRFTSGYVIDMDLAEIRLRGSHTKGQLCIRKDGKPVFWKFDDETEWRNFPPSLSTTIRISGEYNSGEQFTLLGNTHSHNNTTLGWDLLREYSFSSYNYGNLEQAVLTLLSNDVTFTNLKEIVR